ncbi:MAG: lytic transglycosylase domain-containing protein [Paludibacteraceae bacterium]|nr:lytic transglycosylase domain-containing protein [Paludibacteraceae bacterium]MBR4713691.1 lytic transglycosylase domain-containing protein [Paludibacteraceae bacterium]
MKKLYKIGGLAAATIFSLCECAADSTPRIGGTPTQEVHYQAPTIPDGISFCGERVDLTNYYLRERFDRELLSFSYWHSQVFLLIKRANKFFPIIEPILKANGVPDDFKYLALIESNLDQRAQSPAKAVGIWQILPGTGKDAGLVINDDVDERYNVEKATKVACSMLKHTHDASGSWTLAAAAYNTGHARVMRQIDTQQTNNYFDMLFSEETNRYVFRIIMAKYLMEDPQRMGFYLTKEDLYYPVESEVVKVDSTINNLTDFAKERGINYQLLKDANPWLRSNKLPNKEGKEFFIKIPKKEALEFNPQKGKVHQANWVTNP